MLQTRELPLGTCTRQSFPWGLYARNGHRAMCQDGVVRAVEMSATADTFFSIPARCRINGQWVSGYVTSYGSGVSWQLDGYQGPELPSDTLEFRAHTRHALNLPRIVF